MYGGDEVSAIVLDLGSHSCKAGYAGEDAPKAVLPSVVGSVEGQYVVEPVRLKIRDPDSPGNGNGGNGGNTGNDGIGGNGGNAATSDGTPKRKLYAGVQAVGYRRDHMEIVPALKDGLVQDWDIVESIWDHTLRERLMIDPKEHPMLLAEASFNAPPHREKVVELMFENYGVPALFLVKNAVLTSFASGRATSLVVDCGGGSTTIAAVHDGYVLQKAIVRSPIGGDFLTDCMLNILESKGTAVRPRYSFKRKEIRPSEIEVVNLDLPNTTESFRKYMQRAVAADVKESVCRVPDALFEESAYANIPTTPYELPDGQVIEIGADRFKVPDLMFNPALVQRIPGMEKFVAESGASIRGLPHMVIESINKCDVDIRRELFSSILLAGGTAAMQQMKERLEKDLMEEAPQAARVKVLGSGNAIERRFSVWIGGSILASLGSFQQMWLSKAEYEEHGPTYVHRKCP